MCVSLLVSAGQSETDTVNTQSEYRTENETVVQCGHAMSTAGRHNSVVSQMYECELLCLIAAGSNNSGKRHGDMVLLLLPLSRFVSDTATLYLSLVVLLFPDPSSVD